MSNTMKNPYKPHINKEMIDEISSRTGLKSSTVIDLLSVGWVYTSSLGHVDSWLHPLHSLIVIKEKK